MLGAFLPLPQYAYAKGLLYLYLEFYHDESWLRNAVSSISVSGTLKEEK
jgi:hypothetical protein